MKKVVELDKIILTGHRNPNKELSVQVSGSIAWGEDNYVEIDRQIRVEVGERGHDPLILYLNLPEWFALKEAVEKDLATVAEELK